jgi:hypothetical protein
VSSAAGIADFSTRAEAHALQSAVQKMGRRADCTGLFGVDREDGLVSHP